MLATLAATLSLLLTPSLRPAAVPLRCASPLAALDMNDPDVAKEYAEVMTFDTEQIEEELAAGGVVAPPTMNDFDMKSMLVEFRMMKKGKSSKPKPKPASFGSDFEQALYEKPAFKALYEEFKNARLQNEINLCIEYLNDKRRAKERYGGTAKYDETVGRIEAALAAKVEQVVSSPKLFYAGFPANMGESGVRMTLATFGEVVDLSFDESDDGLTCSGSATFDSVDAAKAAIEKYDGVDMGLGTNLQLTAA